MKYCVALRLFSEEGMEDRGLFIIKADPDMGIIGIRS